MENYLTKIKKINEMYEDGLIIAQEAIIMIVMEGVKLCDNIKVNDNLES